MNNVAETEATTEVITTEIETTGMLPISASPSDVIQSSIIQATALMDVVNQQQLFQSIRGKKYLNVEAWQLIGGFTNTNAIPVNLEQIDDEGNIRYKCKVELQDNAGKVIGAGFGEANNSEQHKGNMTAHQIASTAQTRAISKAYRNKFGFIARLAGFEPTTSEEMENFSIQPKPPTPSPKPPTPEPPTPTPTQETTYPEQTETMNSGTPTPSEITDKSDALKVFNIYKDRCLDYVSETALNEIATEIGLKGKTVTTISKTELDELLSICMKRHQDAETIKDQEPDVSKFPIGKETQDNVEQE